MRRVIGVLNERHDVTVCRIVIHCKSLFGQEDPFSVLINHGRRFKVLPCRIVHASAGHEQAVACKAEFVAVVASRPVAPDFRARVLQQFVFEVGFHIEQFLRGIDEPIGTVGGICH